MTSIEFENVGKQYRLGLVSTQTLSHDLHRWWTVNVRGKEDPYLRIGETNDRSVKGSSDYVWALRDINFKVEQGDVVGIIGRNGAGKSTLLKLLSKVTAPTTGCIRARGRIGSLLEVGTGFHPEMTGRENIYMNGAILGMTKPEITRKLDEIVDFSGCERYLDTPVKRYSSGMMVRLGFAVAAHLDPEILVVDEVLAVGDAEFQKKAIGKMKDVSQGEGRTVLFVSHNMNAVKMLCKNGIVLKNGHIDYVSDALDCVNHYLETAVPDVISHTITTEANREDHHQFAREVEIIEAAILNEDPSFITYDEPLKIMIHFKKNDPSVSALQCNIIVSNSEDVRVAFYVTDVKDISKSGEDFDMFIEIPNISLAKGRYRIRLEAGLQDASNGVRAYDHVKDVLSFELKYRHKSKQDEFLFWQPNWGLRYHEEDQFTAFINEFD